MFEKKKKKVVDFSYRYMRSSNYLFTKTRKAHEITAGVLDLSYR